MRLVVLLIVLAGGTAAGQTLWDRVEHGFADNNGVKIHYVRTGEGPVVLMLHGFPDFWYTWRHQMEALEPGFTVVAMDLRGYDLSDRPKGVEKYAMKELISDVVAVIRQLNVGKVTLVGHDWGGAIAWQVAIRRPELVERLVVLSTPHPRGLVRELRNNRQQKENSQYARDFQKDGAHQKLTAESLAAWVSDDDAKPRYLEAFRKSDFEAMLNYYKASFPKQAATPVDSSRRPSPLPNIQCPTLVMFGLQDKALLAAGFNGTWDWIDADLTMVAIPRAGHFVQQDASDDVTLQLKTWLGMKVR